MTLRMQKFKRLSSVAAPIMRINIDTDAIIPSREMKGVTKDGLSVGMFANLRYTDVDARVENPDFILNKIPFRDAEILLSGDNFGCGSSREHAVWALKEWGMRCAKAYAAEKSSPRPPKRDALPRTSVYRPGLTVAGWNRGSR